MTGRDEYILALDLGTSGLKVAVTTPRGEILGSAVERYPLHLLGGGVEQDPGDWWNAIVAGTRQVLETGAAIRDGIAAIPQLRVLGDPLWVVAFTSDTADIYRMLDHMTRRGWSLNGLHRPAAVHLCVTLRHTRPGVARRFLADLRASVAEVLAEPADARGLAPVYGLAATIPFRGMVRDLLKGYLDLLYRP